MTTGNKRASTLDEVYEAIQTERDHQRQKWGEAKDERTSLEAFTMYMNEHLRVMSGTLTRTLKSKEPALATLRKVAALAVACMERHGALPRADYEVLWDGHRLRTIKKAESISVNQALLGRTQGVRYICRWSNISDPIPKGRFFEFLGAYVSSNNRKVCVLGDMVRKGRTVHVPAESITDLAEMAIKEGDGA